MFYNSAKSDDKCFYLPLKKDNGKKITMKNIFHCPCVFTRYTLVNFSICIICFPFGFDAVCTIIRLAIEDTFAERKQPLEGVVLWI